jgi:hypothetical protein
MSSSPQRSESLSPSHMRHPAFPLQHQLDRIIQDAVAFVNSGLQRLAEAQACLAQCENQLFERASRLCSLREFERQWPDCAGKSVYEVACSGQSTLPEDEEPCLPLLRHVPAAWGGVKWVTHVCLGSRCMCVG